MAFPPLSTERAGGAPVSTCPGIISNRVPLPGTVGARGPASRNSGLPGCIRWALVNIPGASRGIPHISRELKAFTTAGRLGERVKEATETVLVPPSLSSQLSEFVTHCHPAGTGSLSLPPPGPHARASLQLPDLEKWDPTKYSSGRLTCSDAEENAGEMQSLQWTGQLHLCQQGLIQATGARRLHLPTPLSKPTRKGRGKGHGSVSGEHASLFQLSHHSHLRCYHLCFILARSG